MNSASSTRPLARPLPRWKKALFGLFTVAAFFMLLEIVLAVVGMRPVLHTRDPFVGFAPLPLYVESEDAAGQVWMTTAPNKLAYFNPQKFPREKPAGAYRIFCLGGSTTYGHPYDDDLSFAAWLRELLPRALPETKWEVINAGGISYASYRVAALMEELARYQPDLFIVYSGHNEFLEERTYGDLRAASAARLRLTAVLARTRTYALIDRAIHPTIHGAPPPNRQLSQQLASEVDAVLDHTAGPSSYTRDDEKRAQILQHYEFNLRRMIDIARSAGARILFVTPASNLRDCSPFKSQHRAGFSPDLVQRFSDHTERGREREQDDPAGAIEEYQAALRIDDRFAEVHYRLGRQLLALDRRAEAAASFRRALDEDVCPLRAVSEIPEIVRRVGREMEAPVVDAVRLLENNALRTLGHNNPGRESFVDHVHLTIEATGQVAAAIVREMAAAELIDPQAAWDDARLAEAAARIESRRDADTEALALRNLAKVLNWAGKHEEAGPLALQALEQRPDDPELLTLGAAYLRSTGDTDQAIDYYRRALRRAPKYVEARRLLGAALVESQQLPEALEQFRELTRLTPSDAHGWRMCGAVLAELGRHAEALTFYHQALQLTPDDPHLHYHLGVSLARLHRSTEAAEHFRRTLQLNPHDKDARQELQAITSTAPPRS